MSLADELLADLEENDDSERMVEEPEPDFIPPSISKSIEEEVKVASVRELAKLRDSEELKKIMFEIEKYSKVSRKSADIIGPVESDPEYQLIVEANNMAVDIDNEIATIHRFTRDKYSKRFPELESLVVGPLEYVMTVRELGNDLDKAKNNETLQQYLTQATIMVVSVTASTTQGQLLSEEEREAICEACDMAVELNNCKSKILEYVESRMAFIAPNLSVIVGASTAAKIMGVAGGLTKLSKMPACNVLVLGSQRTTLSGFSQMTSLPHTGFIYYSEIVQETPPDLRRKAARLVAAKGTLAARVDAFHESTDGHIGQLFRDEIEKKLDKLQEPPPVKFVKPLPKPIDPSRKKRGGKRVRKMKERYAITEFRKYANRMNFADIENDAYQEDLGYSRGTIGKAGTGRIRLPQVDEKTKVRISKTLQKNLQKQQQWGGSTTVKKQVSGTASSVAFTPLQGLEIVNPQAAEKKVNEANAKYFSNTAGFLKRHCCKTMGNAGSNQTVGHGHTSGRDRHTKEHAPPSPGKEGQAFVFDKKPNQKLVFQSSHEEGEPYYTKTGPQEGDNFSGQRPRSNTVSEGTKVTDSKVLPTVFKWEGGGKQVYISGTFTGWKTLPMVKSHGDFVTIIDLPEGEHQYKFYVDGEWRHDPGLKIVDNGTGSKNNLVSVRKSDFEVFQALAKDSEGVSTSVQTEYGQEILPHKPWDKVVGPPILPPHLLQVILNKDTPLSCEPTLLPEPNHVMLNHLYALSIKDSVMVLSATHRYRKKYVTTLLYKPI